MRSERGPRSAHKDLGVDRQLGRARIEVDGDLPSAANGVDELAAASAELDQRVIGLDVRLEVVVHEDLPELGLVAKLVLVEPRVVERSENAGVLWRRALHVLHGAIVPWQSTLRS
jgi:hypothetical protein